MELNFYHTATGALISSIVKLLEKVYKSGAHCVFYSPIGERVEVVDKTLWTFSTNAFIPHGGKSLGFSNMQPIYFTSEKINPNQSKILVSVDNFDYLDWHHDFERIFFVFEDSVQTAKADSLFADLKNEKENVHYWKQTQSGWEKLN